MSPPWSPQFKGQAAYTMPWDIALSATFQSAELAAKSVADDGIAVSVVDSRTVSLGTGTIVLACAELAATLPGDDAALDTVVARAADLVGRTRVFGALDTMDNLKKGGRVGNAKALLATALSIKPIIAVENGVGAAHPTEEDLTVRQFGEEGP